ncbi:putative receptor expression-enhancing protein [Phaeoacremonium minimum UCRPA7]|uniref:Protein YOP1 n=1 Tax=Phaeoacremonium minimum (strain UCR-PA7) TaxID=1286976 RepID=R8BV85_PHAM7|nr:putative receptor expression-enhancing protein [Phaeoacremonium minimum UCRPA7]EOO03286.1 putative receptor expression-enhancing protein [Phaeoacremonium minimum UCRPA7]
MFDPFSHVLSSIASFLFPLFASYKALKTSDPAQLTPWLMYWVVLACGLLVESWVEWFLVWIPFYGYIRLLFLLYLVLPQTQGARVIYTTYLHPWLEDNESQIEDFIATTHDKMKTAGITYIKRAIEAVRVNVLGLPPNPQAAATEPPAAPAAQSYTQALLARFTLPQARWSGGAGSTGQDFYNLLAGAVSAASATVSSAAAAGSGGGAAAASSSGAADPATGASMSMSASGTLIPPNIRGTSEKISFIAAQRERLNIVLSALDREAKQLESGSGGRPEAERRPSSIARDLNLDLAGDDEEPTQRPASGLSKSRSEADFEKIDAESGAEEDEGRTPAVTSGGSWLPWGWGGGSGSGSGSGSGGTPAEEHKKSE